MDRRDAHVSRAKASDTAGRARHRPFTSRPTLAPSSNARERAGRTPGLLGIDIIGDLRRFARHGQPLHDPSARYVDPKRDAISAYQRTSFGESLPSTPTLRLLHCVQGLMRSRLEASSHVPLSVDPSQPRVAADPRRQRAGLRTASSAPAGRRPGCASWCYTAIGSADDAAHAHGGHRHRHRRTATRDRRAVALPAVSAPRVPHTERPCAALADG